MDSRFRGNDRRERSRPSVIPAKVGIHLPHGLPDFALPSRSVQTFLVALGLGFAAVAALAAEPPALHPLAFSGKAVRLFVRAGSPVRPELARLGAELEAAVAAMAPRVPIAVERPFTLIVEPDHVTQARETGEVGEAVAGRGGEAGGAGFDLHLVFDARDLAAYHVALARRLVERAGLARGQRPWIARGAALWLAGDWYGRGYAEWLPGFAAAGALPLAAELLAEIEQRDGSALLWTPAAAAVIEARPGNTLAEKLASPWKPDEVEAVLARIARRDKEAEPAVSRLPLGRGKGLKYRGVSLAMLNSVEQGYHSPSVDGQLDRLRELAADSVAIMPFAYQPAPGRPEMVYLLRGPRAETDIGCLHAARRAHAKGFTVLWKPHVWVSHESWPGEVEMTSEADWRAWWSAYRRYVLHHAFLARWAGAELLAIGVELDKTLPRKREWLELIAAVRRLYPGLLTYAANWYGGLENAPFWDRLDLVGVDAYYPLASAPDASDEALAAGAHRVVEKLAAAAARFGKPLVLTEVGFAARRAAWVDPHREGGELSLRDQAAAYRALLAALEDKTWLAGLFAWKAFSGEVSSPRPDFRFLGRPAAAEIERFYRRVE